ncbi:MAG TPA: hypothetical protein P5243_11390, partial [Bacteroidales bacterium]|nr:hypothetical protein [Bacteroidales bacterium]
FKLQIYTYFSCPNFGVYYTKKRVSEMQIKIIEENRKYHQILLEACIAYTYQIQYFESDTH